MPAIFPIESIEFSDACDGRDVSALIAPPYDVLDEASKATLLERSDRNIVAVDLPHLPPKTVGPPETYAQAGERFRQWLGDGTLERRKSPRCYVYAQTYEVNGARFRRMGLIASLRVRPFGEDPDGQGAIRPHEQTFSSPKEDRLRLMEATRAQLSPIFGLYSDETDEVRPTLEKVAGGEPTMRGTTANDGVLHEVWAIEDDNVVAALSGALAEKDVFIADGHHRYTTAINYHEKLSSPGALPDGHPANFCMFVLVAIQDPGMIVLPTHRALGGMDGFSMATFTKAAGDSLRIEPFAGTDVAALEAALPSAGAHAMGLVHREGGRLELFIATPTSADPLASSHGGQSEAWRQLDVAILQHLIVEQILQPRFTAGGGDVEWKFPHSLNDLIALIDGERYQLGALMQPTPLDSVRQVSEAGELMPQKSTFFYPKLATGMVVHALE